MTAPGVADTAFAFDELGRQIRQGRVEGGATNWLAGSEALYETVGSNVWQTQRSLVYPVDNNTAVTTAVQRVLLSRERAQGNVNPQLLLAALVDDLAVLGAA